MSSEALAWAFKQDVKPSTVKFTLVALCECASYKTGDIYPSIDHLIEITGQNRKTIIGNINELVRLGYIADTGERAGRTKQIKVYRACLERVPQTEQYHKRNSTVYTSKQSQIRDTEPSREPSSSEAKASSDKPDDCLSKEEVIEVWNLTAERCGLPCVRSVSGTRLKHLQAMIRRRSVDEIASAIRAIERNPWMHGLNDRGWRADFDFFVTPSKFDKLIEGSYDRQTKPS